MKRCSGSDAQQQLQAAKHDAWFREQVQVGIAVADTGDLLSSEEVEAEAQAWRAETAHKSQLK